MSLKSPIFCLGWVLAFWLLLAATESQSAAQTNAIPGAPITIPHISAAQAFFNSTNTQSSDLTASSSSSAAVIGPASPATNDFSGRAQQIELLSDGAVARYGSHQVAFAANLNTAGAADLLMRDNTHLSSHIAGIAYYTPSGQSVLIAELKDTVGQVVWPNQVLYTNAFDDVRADVLYTYTEQSLEQDIIIRRQLPSPALWGIDPSQAKIAVLTEFFDPPQPVTYSAPIDLTSLNASAGIQGDDTLPDQLVLFNTMAIGRGRAFTIGDTGIEIPTGKAWQNLDQRWFLVESTPYALLKQQLDSLPPDTGQLYRPRKSQAFRTALLSLPKPKMAENHTAVFKFPRIPVEPRSSKMALESSLPFAEPGVVLDYTITNQLILNFQFGPGRTKTGFAATGLTTNDAWNWYLAPGQTYVTMTNLQWSDQSIRSNMVLTVSNANGQWYNPVTDDMYQGYIFNGGGSIVITLTNLPVDVYDFYIYGHGAADDQNGVFHLYTGTTDHGILSTTQVGSDSWHSDVWQEGLQYIVFRSIYVPSNEVVKLVVQPGTGYSIINGMQITREPVPPYFVVQPADRTVTQGNDAWFNDVIVGGSHSAFQWYSNGATIPNATNLYLHLTNAQASYAGPYYLSVASPLGDTNSRLASLTVAPARSVNAPANLVGWWPGNNNPNDVGPNNNNGTLNGSAGYANGKVLEAFSLDGSSGCEVAIPNGTGLDAPSQLTIEFWMRSDPSNPLGSSIQGLVTSDFYGVEIGGDQATAGVNFFMSTDGGDSWNLFSDNNIGSVMFPAGEWHHIAATYDGANIVMYLDGVIWGNPDPCSGTIAAMNDGSYISIGSEDGRQYCPDCVAGRYYKGLIDEVSIYNRALTSNEISSIYNTSFAGKFLDSNGDNIPDWWCYEYGFGISDPTVATNDPDGDGLNNLQEYLRGSNPTNFDAVQLGYWRFNTTSWVGEQGQTPLIATNLRVAASWSTNAVLIDTNATARLKYLASETNGNDSGTANLLCTQGSVSFWFAPDWSSTTTNSGTGPGGSTDNCLVEEGASTNQWWALTVNTTGTHLFFETKGNGLSIVTNLNATINWNAWQWHQIVLTYGLTNSSLYVDGAPVVTNGLGVTNYPDPSTRTSTGFNIGTDQNGNNQARGRFDELQTYNYALTSQAISNSFTKPCYPALDVALLIDRTKYMLDPSASSNMVLERLICSNLVQNLNLTYDQISVFSFANGVITNLILTNNSSTIISTINSISPDGSSTSNAMAAAITAGQSELASARHQPRAFPVIVLLSEGQDFGASGTAITNAANAAKQAGTFLITVVMGEDGLTSLIQPLASSSNDCYFVSATNTAQLNSVYNSLSGLICRPPTNQPPSVSLSSPANNQIFPISPTNILLTANVTKGTGTITDVSFYRGTSLLGQATAAPYQFLWTDVTNGTYALSAVVQDNLGLSSTSATNTVILNAMPTVSITSPTNRQVYTNIPPITSLTLAATASDSDGQVTNVRFFSLTNLLGNATSNGMGSWTYTWTSNFVVGAYPITAVAADNRGAAASSPIVVFSVTFANPLPVVQITSPTNGQTFSPGSDITITATATETNGSVTNVAFFVNGQPVGNSPGPDFAVTVCCWKTGTYRLQAVATDTNGNTACSSPNVTITVNPQPPEGGGFWDPVFANGTVNIVYGSDNSSIWFGSALAIGSNNTVYAGEDYIFQSSNETNWTALEGSTRLDHCCDDFYSLIVNQGVLYGTGPFRDWPDNSDYDNYGAFLWNSVSNGWFPVGDPLADGTVLAVCNGDIYMGGAFSGGLVKLDRASNHWVSVGNGVDNRTVMAIAAVGTNLYIGGDFTHAGGDPNANYIAKLVNNHWTNVGGSINFAGTIPTYYPFGVTALAACGSNLFVGGTFTNAGTLTNLHGLGLWNGKDWLPVGDGIGQTTWTGPLHYLIRSLSARGNRIFVGGAFTNVLDGTNSIATSCIAMATWSQSDQKWTWSGLDGGLHGQGAGAYQTAIAEGALPGSYDLYVSGDFNTAGSSQMMDVGVARWRVGYPPPPGRPSISITNPASGTVITNNPSTITIIGPVKSSVNIDHVNLFQNGTLIVTNLATNGDGTFSYTWDNPGNGVYTLTASAVDVNGLIGLSPPSVIMIKSTSSITASNDVFTILTTGTPSPLFVLTNDLPTNGLRISQVAPLQGFLGSVSISHDRTYVNYRPPPSTYGTDTFVYSVTNGSGATDSAFVIVNIQSPPYVSINLPGDGFVTKPASNVTFSGSALSYGDGVQLTNLTLTVNGAVYLRSTNATNLSSFTTNWSTNQLGFYTFLASATDNRGLSTTSAPVTVAVWTNQTAILTAEIDNLGAPISALGDLVPPFVSDGLFDLKGLAEYTDGRYSVSYQVEVCQPQSDGTDTPVANVSPAPVDASGFHSGTDLGGDLGTLDFTTVPNGIYDLVLTVRAAGTNVSVTNRFVLNSNLKIGQFSFSQQDLVLPVNGIPMTVTRTYNSMNDVGNDFGHCWTLSLNSMDVALDEYRQDVTTGTSDAPFYGNGSTDANGLPRTVSIRTGGARDITLTLPDGRRETFVFHPRDAGFYAYAQWDSPPGITATITNLPTESPIINYLPSLAWQDGGMDSTYENYDEPGWILSTQDGTQYYITRGPKQVLPYSPNNDGNFVQVTAYGTPQLTSILQRTGDQIAITNTGITHYSSNGVATRSVWFDRDGQGRITGLHDPISGPTGLPVVQYVYDQDNGNLVQVLKLVDRTAGTYVTNKYYYDNPNFPHYITSVENADGSVPARTLYDGQGRMTGIVDALGHTNSFFPTTSSNMETVVDRLNHTNTYFYDSRGNVTISIDALGNTTQKAYDANNNPIMTIDAMGNTNFALYDSQNNLLATTNALGYTNGFTYDAQGHVLTTTDARGFITINGYDTNTGNLQYTANALNQTNSYVYDGNGLLIKQIDAVGNKVTNGYDASGNLTNTVNLDTNGVQLTLTTFAYDGNGNRTNEVVWRTTNSVFTPETNTFVYDGQNRLVETIDPMGYSTSNIYDLNGRLIVTIDKLGNGTTNVYDDQGQLISTLYPDGTSETTVYDAVGRRSFFTNRLMYVTQYSYDALGRLTNTLNPDTTATSTAYDQVGRMQFTIDARGFKTAYGYDAVGQQIALTNALGKAEQMVITNSYDPNGNRLTMTDASNHVTTYVYDKLNRLATNIYPDTTFDYVTYDSLGRKATQTDQAGKQTQFGYDPLGRLTSVKNALNKTTSYGYDEVGNEVLQTDALTHQTKFTYDALGRRTQRQLPGLQTETNVYDAEGNLQLHTDFNGNSILNLYDGMHRLTNVFSTNLISNTSTLLETYSYDNMGQLKNRTDGSGAYSWVYDSMGRILTNTTPVGKLIYAYDQNGNQTNLSSATTGGVSIFYQYDALNRLTNVLDKNFLGATNMTTNTSYAYDAVGNLRQIKYPNAVAGQYQYDTLNRLKQLTWSTNGATLALFTNTFGLAGNRTSMNEILGTATRGYVWGYDDAYRLTSETISTNSPTGTLTYTYDDAGNRSTRTGSLGGLGSQSPTYNSNDWLVADGYDSNGNTTSSGTNSYQYDYANRLVNVNSGAIMILYGADGNRIQKSNSTTITLYLVATVNPTGYPQVVEELTAIGGGATNLSRVYTYGLALISQRQVAGGASTNFFVTDGHRSTRMLLDSGAQLQNAFVFDAFGTLIASSALSQVNYLYSAEQLDAEDGLYYLRARYFNTGSGRFLTMDNYEGVQGDPLSLHKYAYGADNPINNFDPSGNDFIADVVDIGDSFDSFAVNAQPVLKKAMSVAYRQRAFNLLTTVIRPTLNAIQNESGTKLAGQNAEYMLLGTCIAETGDLNTRRQKGNGPARGLFQMEPFTHDDLWKNYLSFRPKLRDAVLKHFNIKPPADAQLLEGNDSYAAIMARVRYLPVNDPIPSATDLNGQALYWVKYYNRGGKGTVADYLSRWHAAMGL